MVGFGYVTVVASALAFVAWFTGLRHLPLTAVDELRQHGREERDGLGVRHADIEPLPEGTQGTVRCRVREGWPP
jgi:hypothetical protein